MYFFTQENESDPSMLSDEATFGTVMATPHNLIQPLQGPPVPNPNTATTRLWIRGVVFGFVSVPVSESDPDVAPNSQMVYHSYIMSFTCMYEMLTCTVLYTKTIDCALFHSW